jgi:hypothetical protein
MTIATVTKTNREAKHGSRSTYLKYGCRCKPCCDSQAKYNELRVANRKRKRIPRIQADRLLHAMSLAPTEVRTKYANHLSSWARLGADIWTADRACIDMKMHPIEVFGQLWTTTALELDEHDEN